MKDEGSGFAVAVGGCPLVTALFMKDRCCPSDDIECPEGLRVKGLGTSGTFGASRWTAEGGSEMRNGSVGFARRLCEK